MEPEPTLMIWNIKTGFPFKRISVANGEELDPIWAMCFVGSGLEFIGLIHQKEMVKVVKGNADGKVQQKTVVHQSVSIWFFGSPHHRARHHSGLHADGMSMRMLMTLSTKQNMLKFNF